MSKFLNLLNEQIPTGEGMNPSGSSKPKPQGVSPIAPAGTTKKQSFASKIAGGVKKAVDVAQSIERIGTGKWSIDNLLQGIMDKELDKGTAKLGMFGKRGYTSVVLGDEITTQINSYGVEGDKKEEEVIEGFLYKVYEAKKKVEAHEGKKGTGKGDIHTPNETKQTRMDLAAKAKKYGVSMTTPAGKKRKESTIENEIQKIIAQQRKEKGFKPVGDTKSAKERLLPVIKKIVGDKDADYFTTYVTKNLNTIISKIKTYYGPEGPYVKQDKNAKPLEFEFDLKSLGRITAEKQKQQKAKKEREEKTGQKEMDLTENIDSEISLLLKEAVSDDLVKNMGRDGAEDFLKSVEKIYPGKQITFPKQEVKVGDKPGESPSDDTKITGNSLFTLSKPQNYGAKGTQYTLVPQQAGLEKILNSKGIKYITYLTTKPNSLGSIDKNDGTINIFDMDDQPITKLSNIKAPFKWNSELKAYAITKNNELELGPQPDKGEGLISSDNENIVKLFYGKNPPTIVMKDPSQPLNAEGLSLSQYKVIRRIERTNQIIFDKRNALPLSEEDRREVLKANKGKMSKSAGLEDVKALDKKVKQIQQGQSLADQQKGATTSTTTDNQTTTT